MQRDSASRYNVYNNSDGHPTMTRYTTIGLEPETKKRLERLMTHEETFEQIVNKLIDLWEMKNGSVGER